LTGNVDWTWGKQQQEVFETIKQLVSSAPVLASPPTMILIVSRLIVQAKLLGECFCSVGKAPGNPLLAPVEGFEHDGTELRNL
jgi:hypothetical protein